MGRSLVSAGIALALTATTAATAAPPRVALSAGQTRWFLPGELRAGELVACVVGGRKVTAPVPATKPGAAAVVGASAFADGAAIALDARPNGAVQARCGDTAAAPRLPVYPYLVGRNGLGSIPGPNSLVRIRALFGDGTASTGSAGCRVTWTRIGLVATFAGTRCSGDSLLLGARITSRRWTSLSGVRIGDPVARMVWQDQGARLVSRAHGRSTWLLGGAGAKPLHRLVAVVARGRVASLVVATG
jgi:hypothetical protein